MADSVGSVSVDVVPDASGFKQRLDAKLKNLNVKVGLDADIAALRTKIENATKTRAVTVNVDADTAAAEAQLDAVARNRTAKVDVDMDSSSVAAASRNVSGLAVAVAALGPALVPVTAAVAGLGAALAAPVAAAGGGLTVWGFLAGVAIKQANTNLAEVEKAKTALAATTKGTKEHAEALKVLKAAQKEVTPEQKKFSAALLGVQNAVVKLGQAGGKALLGPVTQGLNLVAIAIKRSKPLIIAVGGAISDVLAGIGKAVRGPAFKSFIAWFAKNAPKAIKGFAKIAGNVAVGIGGLVKAFAPLGGQVLDAVVKLTGKFAKFGKTASDNKGVKGFIAYVREVGPKVAQFFGNLLKAVGKLAEVFAPLGELLIAGANAVARFIGNAKPGTIAALAGAVGALAAWFLPGAGMIAGIVAVAGALAYAYKHSETFRKAVNKLGDVAGRVFKAIVKWVKKELLPIMKRAFNQVIVPAVKGVITVVKDLMPVWRALGKLIAWNWKHILKPAINAMIWLISKVLFPTIKFLYTKVVRPTFRLIGKAISFAWNKVIKPVFGWLGDRFHDVGRGIQKVGGWIHTVWDNLGGGLGKAWNWIKDKLDAVIGKVKDVIGWIKDAFSWLDKLNANAPKSEKEWAGEQKFLPDGTLNPNYKEPEKHATGGFITKPTLSWVGEGKEAEAILPTSVLRGLMAAAGAAGARASGGHLGLPNESPRPRGGGFLQHTSPPKDFLKKTFRQVKRDTVGMEMAVGKGTKKLGKYWEHLRKSDLPSLQKRWHQVHKQGVLDANMLDKGVAKNTRQMGKSFLQFRQGPLKSFGSDWGQTFRKSTPNDVSVFRSKTLDQFGKTRSGIDNTWKQGIKPTLKTFGQYPKQDVAPAFGKGVDAIGKQWSKVEKATGKPIRSVVDVQLNKGLLAAFNKIAKFVDTKTIDKIKLPKFATGSWIPGHAPSDTADNVTIRATPGEFMVRRKSAREIEKQRPGFLERINRMGAKALPGHANGGFVNPDKRVYLDGEPIAAIAAAQIGLASRFSKTPIHVMQGGWQPPTSYSGTSHQYPGVADTSPGSFNQQKWLRKVGFAAWARNIPGAHYAGSGAHVHSVSLLSPGTRGSSQIGDYLHGGDGLGGSDYGPRPKMLPNLQELLKRFGPLPNSFGGLAPILPKWAQKIIDAPKKWARGLLDANLSGGFGRVTQGLLNALIAPSAEWATSALSSFSGGGVPGGPMPGPKQLSKASPELAKRYAYGRLKAFGFGKNQWNPLQKLWTRESGWRWNADNPSSAAYGIPQANPGSKMAATGANWRTNAGTQINWGLGYIKGTYGNPANAWAHSEAHNWYDKGGIARYAGLLPKMTPEPERVLAPRQTVAFEQMVRRNFQPQNNQPPGEFYLKSGKVTLADGGAYIEGVAVAANARHSRASRGVAALYG